MDTAYYSLRIRSSKEQIHLINGILGISVIDNSETDWIYEIANYESEPYFDFITHFLDILRGKFKPLEKIGVKRSDISFWAIYEYQEQFNVEYRPQDMRKMVEENITLCISCYQV